MTPYQYAALNPIRKVDINGDSIKINYNNQKILYQNGRLYNNDGTEYKGSGANLRKDGSVRSYKGFLGDTFDALQELGRSSMGSTELNNLEDSKNLFTISDATLVTGKYAGKNRFVVSNAAGAYAGEKQEVGEPFTFGGSGGTIFFNPNDATLGTVSEQGGGFGFHPATNLGHEFSHAFDANWGQLRTVPINGLETSEWRASYRENLIRSQLGYPYRSQYNLQAGSVSILDANGNPMNVIAPAPHQ